MSDRHTAYAHKLTDLGQSQERSLANVGRHVHPRRRPWL